MPTPGNAAIQYHPDAYRGDREQIKGRHAAGAGFLSNFLRHGEVDRFWGITSVREDAKEFASLAAAVRPGVETTVVPDTLAEHVQDVGCVQSSGPNSANDAWARRLDDDRAFSICGLTHTVSSDRVAHSLGALLTSPVQPWDALICTSTSVRKAVERTIDEYAAFYEARMGARPETVIQLPIIPLGATVDTLAPTPERKSAGAALRSRLGIASEDLVFLYVGRLSFHAKAHPVPMYLALAEAQRRCPDRRLHLIMAGQFPNQPIETAIREAAQKFGGGVPVHFLDGRSDEAIAAAWGAGDVFISLSDNIQESFGLTPVEAMAAGMPVIGSDWDGYKDTIVHGETGFLIPSWTPGPGSGREIARRYQLDVLNYDNYIGRTCLSTSVDIARCADAIVSLATNPALQHRMGEAGLARARAVYDWKVIVGQYQDLWGELAERRAKDAVIAPRHRDRAPNPKFADPFAIFDGHPTSRVTIETMVHPGPATDLETVRKVANDGTIRFGMDLLGTHQEVMYCLETVSQRPMTVGALETSHKTSDPERFRRTLLWMAKFDLVRLEEPEPR